jgi:hypothetical protein
VPKRKRIGPKADFQHNNNFGAVMAVADPSLSCGVWLGKSNFQAYLGLKFTIKGNIHFGWARVKVDTLQRPFSATLTGYAYEPSPAKRSSQVRLRDQTTPNQQQPSATTLPNQLPWAGWR